MRTRQGAREHFLNQVIELALAHAHHAHEHVADMVDVAIDDHRGCPRFPLAQAKQKARIFLARIFRIFGGQGRRRQSYNLAHAHRVYPSREN